jgi:Rod binding domain-containing protein
VGSMDTYREWRDDQLAQTLSTKGTMGFADMLVKQLAPALNNNAKMGIASDLVDEQGATQPAQPLSRTHSSGNNMSGWWKVPAADIPELPKSTNEVGLPTTEESLLLRNLLQGKITTQPKQS